MFSLMVERTDVWTNEQTDRRTSRQIIIKGI